MKNKSLLVMSMLLLLGLIQSLVLTPVSHAAPLNVNSDVDALEVNQADGCSVTISPATVTVDCGNEIQFAAIPTGTCETPDYTWSVISTIGGTITQSGLYTAGENCTDRNVTDIITVTDRANDNITATATVKVGSCTCFPPLTVEPSEGQQGQTYTVELSTTEDSLKMFPRNILLLILAKA